MSRVERLILAAAGAVTLVITVGAFTLSYEHLAWVAGEHGLGGSPVRQWMWPGCLDAFVIAGELLMLRASLAHRVDWWAVALVVVGAGGSIALNVAGVGAGASMLDYVVAAVPPVAALLAFGALARQIHGFLSGRAPERTAQPSTSTEQPQPDEQEHEPPSTPPVLAHDEHEHRTPPPVLAPKRARAVSQGGSLAQLARELLDGGASNEQAAARIIEQLPAAKPDSVKAAVRRERRALAGAAT